MTEFQLLYYDWRGYLISMFSLVWLANVYMSLFGFIRVGLKKEKMDAEIEELKLKSERAKITKEEKS
jgi:hypothetical protein